MDLVGKGMLGLAWDAFWGIDLILVGLVGRSAWECV